MASSRERQRALARAKLERQMARRAAEARRRRQIQAGIAAVVAVGLVIVGAVLLVKQFGGEDKASHKKTATNAPKTPGPCKFKKASAKELKANKNRKDVGMPKAGDETRSGTKLFTLKTNRGTIQVTLDAKKAPCNTESLAYLAGKKFFDGTSCHRLTTQGLYVLQCGDPSGTGSGGPTYTVNDENLPVGQTPAYPEGVVAMANSGPNTNSSQIFIVYKDSQLPPNYAIVGKVTTGLDVVKKVAKAGVKAGGQQPGDGKPKLPLKIETATVAAPGESEPSTEPSKS